MYRTLMVVLRCQLVPDLMQQTIIMQVISLVWYIFRVKDAENKCAEYCMKCCICCLWCLEKCLKYLNQNAYTIVGKSKQMLMSLWSMVYEKISHTENIQYCYKLTFRASCPSIHFYFSLSFLFIWFHFI